MERSDTLTDVRVVEKQPPAPSTLSPATRLGSQEGEKKSKQHTGELTAFSYDIADSCPRRQGMRGDGSAVSSQGRQNSRQGKFHGVYLLSVLGPPPPGCIVQGECGSLEEEPPCGGNLFGSDTAPSSD